MNEVGQRILVHLQAVEAERAAREAEPTLKARALALKAYQQQRFRRTYADMLADDRYRGAALFFLEELYGPEDFSARDAQFARIVPALVRLFPHEIVQTVEQLAALHALSERLDSQMARRLASEQLTAGTYVQAWQATGMRDAREEQVRLTLEVGRSLDRFTRNPVLRHSLRLMRGPARAAGLASLQAFLERGFDTFRAMRGAEGFLRAVAEREQRFSAALFAADVVALATLAYGAERSRDGALGQLP
jgi:hypothetical protein